jgi:ABC-type glycerol-3-phosphate transport system substrate-binding protein
MQIGLPYVNLDAFQLLDTGMGTLNLFPTLLMQNGSAVYNDEHTGTRFDEPAAYQAFKQWTDFYRLFDFPLYKDDFNRFRTGEMPVVITSYKLYNRLVRAAPEIAGMWKMVPIPGVRKSEGNIDRSADATGTAAIILKDADNKQDAWEFLKWWSRPDIQSQFTKDLESEMGVLGRRIPANLEAFKNTNWSRDEQAVLLEQWKAVREIPEIPGGYYTSRNIDNAFRDVIFQGENPRESLYYWNKQINEEIRRKRYEFGVDQ